MAVIQNLKISNVETLEIRLSPGRTKYFFTEVSDLLKGKKIVDIVSPIDGSWNGYRSPTGATIYSDGNAYLTLSISGKEKIKDYPLCLLDPQNVQIRPSFDDLQPDWSKSYLNILGTILEGQSMVLCVMFND